MKNGGWIITRWLLCSVPPSPLAQVRFATVASVVPSYQPNRALRWGECVLVTITGKCAEITEQRH